MQCIHTVKVTKVSILTTISHRFLNVLLMHTVLPQCNAQVKCGPRSQTEKNVIMDGGETAPATPQETDR